MRERRDDIFWTAWNRGVRFLIALLSFNEMTAPLETCKYMTNNIWSRQDGQEIRIRARCQGKCIRVCVGGEAIKRAGGDVRMRV